MEVFPMQSATVRVSQRARRTLRTLARRTGEPMQSVLDKAIEEYRRRCFLEEANRAFAALRRNPKAWKQELEERRAWDSTVADGLEEK